MFEIVLPLGGRLFADRDESLSFVVEFGALHGTSGLLVLACRAVSINQLGIAYQARVRA
jgi:hypothetical protein